MIILPLHVIIDDEFKEDIHQAEPIFNFPVFQDDASFKMLSPLLSLRKHYPCHG